MQTNIHALSGIRTHDPSDRANETVRLLEPTLSQTNLIDSLTPHNFKVNVCVVLLCKPSVFSIVCFMLFRPFNKMRN
jgi:hypothetical protein